MAKRRKSRPKKRREPREVEETGPTPETRAKLTEDPIQAMVEAQLIDTAGERAAEEIEQVVKAICNKLGIKIGSYRDTIHGPTDMPDNLSEAYTTRYKPWCLDVTAPVAYRVTRVVLDRIADDNPAEIALALQMYARRF